MLTSQAKGDDPFTGCSLKTLFISTATPASMLFVLIPTQADAFIRKVLGCIEANGPNPSFHTKVCGWDACAKFPKAKLSDAMA